MRISDWSSDVCSSDLSEVIIGFAWSTLLSRTAGISNLLVAVGLLDQPVALVPNFAAVLTGMVYQALPYTILVLYPELARLDNSIVVAALTDRQIVGWGKSVSGVVYRCVRWRINKKTI